MSKKTNYSYVGIAFIILVFGIIVIPRIIDRISANDISRDESRSKEVSVNAESQASDLVYIPIDGKNMKVPDFSFTNQDGQVITNKDYLGKVYIVEFFFTTCPTICPRMNRNLVDIQNEFKQFSNFAVASFTINPDYDTQQVLKDYATSYGVTNPNWHFMTGNEADIYELANRGFNIYAGKNPNVEGGFEHSGNFALIDKDGYIRSRADNYGNPMIYYSGIISEEEGEEDGQKQQISMLKEDIAKLLKE